jgi:hypothetical protein
MKTKKKSILEASYLNQNEASQKLSNLGYKYDHDLSTPESKVFADGKGKPHIAFRGSKRVMDYLGSDVKLALGLDKYDRRFREAKHLTQLVESKYGQGADVYGHSLGGSLAEKSGAKGKIVTYNKGAGIFDIGRKIGANQVDHRTKNDVVSLLSLTQSHHNKLREYDNGKQALDIVGNHSIV